MFATKFAAGQGSVITMLNYYGNEWFMIAPDFTEEGHVNNTEPVWTNSGYSVFNRLHYA